MEFSFPILKLTERQYQPGTDGISCFNVPVASFHVKRSILITVSGNGEFEEGDADEADKASSHSCKFDIVSCVNFISGIESWRYSINLKSFVGSKSSISIEVAISDSILHCDRYPPDLELIASATKDVTSCLSETGTISSKRNHRGKSTATTAGVVLVG